MPYRSFLIPIRDAQRAERELNDFIRSHRVLAVDRHWVDRGENSFWAVWVDDLEPSPDRPSDVATSGSKRKLDYKEVLSPEDFAVFAQLRLL
jgi:hypothetical protein